jgi:hypothetical protein
MRDTTHNAGLRIIFSIFLGLMLTAFAGIGVYTFHPPPGKDFEAQMRDLTREEQGIRGSKSSAELTDEDRDRIDEIRSRRRVLSDETLEARKPWFLSTSIILIVFSTLLLVVSLVRADQLQVISSGLLLGGVFTMLYGVGWIAFTGTSVLRFVVITIALLITVGLGYYRFVRGSRVRPTAQGEETTRGADLEEIEGRIRMLEERLAEAANALGRKD